LCCEPLQAFYDGREFLVEREGHQSNNLCYNQRIEGVYTCSIAGETAKSVILKERARPLSKLEQENLKTNLNDIREKMLKRGAFSEYNDFFKYFSRLQKAISLQNESLLFALTYIGEKKYHILVDDLDIEVSGVYIS
jgi:hypothetical protein